MTLDEILVRIDVGLRTLIENVYSDAERHYHNLDHLRGMLRWVEPDHSLDIHHGALVDAILFHDWCYEIGNLPAGLNEAFSLMAYCDMAREVGLDMERLKTAVECINATAYHHVHQPNLSRTAQLMVDLDLQSFGQPWDEFRRDSEALEREYAKIPPEAFWRGARAFLASLQARPQLYYLRTEWEAAARHNIAARIAEFDDRLGQV